MMSQDMTQENIIKIQELFPNAVAEIKDDNGNVKLAIDFDVLKQELNSSLISEKQERYQMTWPDKKQSILLSNKSVLATLRPLPEKSVDFSNTKNVYIEGDNLDVLKLLRETYLGKIKMIYIDPPYNTGNDFVYNDDFSQTEKDYLNNSGEYDESGSRLYQNVETNGRFHTDWLNMMYPRIKVAKDLLTDDGAIFISIDDNELNNLRMMCDEIFGERNFVGQFMWYKSATPPNLSYKIKKNLEYVLCYEKNKTNTKYKGIKKESPSDDPFTKPQNSLKTLTFKAGVIHFKGDDGVFEPGVYGTDKFPNKLLNKLVIENGVNKQDVSFENKFIWTQETLDENIKNNVRINLSKNLVLSYKRESYDEEVPPNLIDGKVGVGTTEEAGKKLNTLFDGNKVFDYPKPVQLIEYLANFLCGKEDIILDFFSGSGTTAEAVMEMNSRDDGNRKYILVQISEKCSEDSPAFKIGFKYITDIAEERIRRAGNIIKAEAGLLGHSFDIGFRVFKLDSSNMNEVYYNPKAMTQNLLEATVDNIKPDRTALDLLFQVMLECGGLLSSKIEEKDLNGKRVYIVEDNYIAACFDEELDDKTIEAIAKLRPIYACFKGSSFNSDSANINAEQIFKTYSPNTEKIKVI